MLCMRNSLISQLRPAIPVLQVGIGANITVPMFLASVERPDDLR